MNRQLYRSRTNYVLAGVCGGLGEYLNINATIVRIFFILLAAFTGTGVLLYLLLWFLIPQANQAGYNPNDVGGRFRQMGLDLGQAVRAPSSNAVKFVGIALVITGIVIFVKNLNLPWLAWLNTDLFWPALLILGGVVLIYRALKGR
jgi:phage shock protein C